ncbi:hypothetical protein [Paramagnetospirillum marisnigri]|uniref:hypothetical protein n=1 Tax=Paramagnetospirillum marisnigri TaxID=1285242 RepID=UPI0012E8CBA4|nr:hypothetical protein [Paramagnetospirillum marisnigri]
MAQIKLCQKSWVASRTRFSATPFAARPRQGRAKKRGLADEYATEVFQSAVLGTELNSNSDCFEAALAAMIGLLG